MSEEGKRSENIIFFVGSLITSAIGGILLLATDFGTFDGSNYYLGVYIYGGIDAWTSGLYGVPIILCGSFLLFCTVISFLLLRLPEKIPDNNYIRLGFYLSFVVFTISIIGGIVFAVEMESEDAWWWFEAGFYGGSIGGLLTSILFYLGIKDLGLDIKISR
jgi:hypothetical protein